MTIIPPGDGLTARTGGGKAAALAVATRAGFRVPEWFVVTRDGPHTAQDLAIALAALSPNGELVAVRSSAIDEDGATRSFAGQFESFLDVAVADVPDRLRDVWRSGSTDRVEHYRREHDLDPDTGVPAAIIQRMVHPACAGVAFSADPVSGRREVAVVSAVRGLGASLVSGAEDGDVYHVDAQPAIVSRRPCGTDPVMQDAQILEVAALARNAARLFGSPQDIEWAFDSGTLYLLQSRPITSLPLTPEADGVLRLWDNSNIIESYSGVTTPLTFSFAREAYEGVYRQFCRVMRVPEFAIAEHDDVFRNMLGLIRGRIYYNLLNWYRLIALLPGFAVNRRFMEQMMGVGEKLPAALLPAYERPRLATRLRDGVRLAMTMAGLAVSYIRLRARTAAFYARVDSALATPDPPLTARRADEITAYYGSLRRQLLTRWDAPILNDFFTMIFHGLVRDLSARWCGDADGALQNDLIAGEPGMISTQPAWRVRQLADVAARSASFTDRLSHGSTTAILDAARDVPGFIPQYEAYLRVFGERCADELKLESETLEDDPLPLLRAVGHLAGRAHPTGADTTPAASSARQAAEQRMRRALAWHPVRRAIFGWVLSNARARVRDRENLRYVRTRLFGRVRRLFVALGARLHDAGVLDDPRDIFYLQVDEILGFVDGRAVTTELKPLVAARRAEFAAHERAAAPDARFETRGIVYLGNAFRAQAGAVQTSVAAEGERRGLGCCPGVRRGQVCVVRDPAHAVLHDNCILVAERTDPGWIMIFPSAAGLIVERGSLLSHSAIVARELGLPSIVSVAGVTSWLRDGDWVEMDGSSGIVRKLAA